MGMTRAKYDAVINEIKSKKSDVTERTIPFYGGTLKLLYIRQLVSTSALQESIIKPLVHHCTAERAPLKPQHIMESVIYADDCQLELDYAKVEYHILGGMVVLLFSNDPHYIVANLRDVAQRAVSSPEILYSIRAPRDAFGENLDTNISLIRYRLKDKNLCIEYMEVGERTKSRVAVTYIDDIANPTAVNEMKKRIGGIQVSGIYESGELSAAILNSKGEIFNQVGILERSDNAVEDLLEGKVVVLVDGSPLALYAPVVFVEGLAACDDRYENSWFVAFMRVIRYIAIYIAFTASSFYIALASYYPDTLGPTYIVEFALMRSRAPFNAFIAVLLLEFIVELIRESMLRVPKKIGATVGIVGGIIIGQAAISSGFFTPFLLILAATAFLASFAIPDFTLMNSFRIIKYLVIVLTGTFGFYGMTLVHVFILAKMVSVNNFGIPFMAPWAPFNRYDTLRAISFKKTFSPWRKQYLRNKDNTQAPTSEAVPPNSRNTYHHPSDSSQG